MLKVSRFTVYIALLVAIAFWIVVETIHLQFSPHALHNLRTLKNHTTEAVPLNITVTPTRNETTDIVHSAIRGYLLTLSVDQQLTGGLKGFTQLATLAAIFNLSTVEPYVQGSRLVGVPRLSEGRAPGAMRLSDLYDWEDLRRLFKTCSTRDDHQLSSFKTFLKNASREVIMVHMVKTEADYNSTFSGSRDKVIDANPIELFLSSLDLLNKWAENVLKHQTKFAPFRFSRIILMDARPTHALPLSVIKNNFGSIIDRQVSKYSSATVVFVNWRAITSTVPRGSYYYIPGFSPRPCQGVDLIKYSRAVINASLLFSQSLNDSGTTVGVHIRGERLLTQYKGNIANCFKKLDYFLHNLTLNESRLGVRIVHDLGEYGTMSCNSGVCSKERKGFVSKVLKLGYPVVSFDPAKVSFALAIPGFVAFVEAEYLSNVDVLVTLGWGGFQNGILRRFMLQHTGIGRGKSHQICNSPSSS